MRLMLDLIVGINAMAGVIGLTIRHLRRSRRAQEALEHEEYQALLRHRLDELDKDTKRLGL